MWQSTSSTSSSASSTPSISEIQQQGEKASSLLVTSSPESPSGSKSASSTLDKAAAGSEDALFMSILLMVFPWLPASNLFFYVGFVVAGQLFLIKYTQKLLFPFSFFISPPFVSLCILTRLFVSPLSPPVVVSTLLPLAIHVMQPTVHWYTHTHTFIHTHDQLTLQLN